MKLLKDPPTEDMLIMDKGKSGEKRTICKLFLRVPIEVSEVQLDREKKMWTTHSGLRFRHSKDMIKYYQDLMLQQGRPLEPGTYDVAVRQVQTLSDRVILHTKEGTEIIIKLS